VLLVLARRRYWRWACKAALLLAVLRARATRPSVLVCLGRVLRLWGASLCWLYLEQLEPESLKLRSPYMAENNSLFAQKLRSAHGGGRLR
jgi:hypothetical protein